MSPPGGDGRESQRISCEPIAFPRRALLPACPYRLPPEHVPRRVAGLHRARHGVALVVPDVVRRPHLPGPQDAFVRPRLHDDAVAADGDNPYRDRVAVGELDRPAFAVGRGGHDGWHHDAVLRAHHGFDVPGAGDVGEFDAALLRGGGVLGAGDGGVTGESDGGNEQKGAHGTVLEREVSGRIHPVKQSEQPTARSRTPRSSLRRAAAPAPPPLEQTLAIRTNSWRVSSATGPAVNCGPNISLGVLAS